MKPPIANPLTPALAASQQQADDPVAEELAALREGFPQFRIWREDAFDRARFVARSLRKGLNPHTVVTDDLAELRTALEASRDNVTSRNAGQPPRGEERHDGYER